MIDRYHQGEELPRRAATILQIGERYGFIFGNGLIANFLEAYYATGNPSPSTGAKCSRAPSSRPCSATRLRSDLFRRFEGGSPSTGRSGRGPTSRRSPPRRVPGDRPRLHAVLPLRREARALRAARHPLHRPGLILDLPRISAAARCGATRSIDAVAREVLLRADEPISLHDRRRHCTRAPPGADRSATGPKLRASSFPAGGYTRGCR